MIFMIYKADFPYWHGRYTYTYDAYTTECQLIKGSTLECWLYKITERSVINYFSESGNE